MEIRDLMTPMVALATPGMTLAEAARVMRAEDVGALPVGEGDRLVGMITDRDIVIRGVAEDVDPAATSVEEIMSDRVLYCFDDQKAEEVARNMGDNRIRRLPVVDRDKRLVGIVALADLARRLPEAAAAPALNRLSQPAS